LGPETTLWRPALGTPDAPQVFQLHPQAYQVGPGHIIKLELLPDDSPCERELSQCAMSESRLPEHWA
jgi:hypothetical protein